MGNKFRILWIGDGGVATGFARVNHSIINNLPKNKYDIHHLAINYRGDPYPQAEHLMYPAFIGGDLYGFGRIQPLLDYVRPDLVFILNDTWILYDYLSRMPENIKVVTYFPVDAKPLDGEWCQKIVERSTPVAYTEFGKQAILDNVKTDKVRVIPHGLDTSVFYPIGMREARSHLVDMEDDEFVVLNANRNQPRKRFDLTIKGFAEFARNKPKSVKLYCHAGLEDAGWNLIKMCKRHGIVDRLILTSLDLSPAMSVSDERLNWIYNACDVGLNTGMGEGWGLTTFEHAACKRAQVVPDSSATSELYHGLAYLIPIDHYDTYPGLLTEGAVVTPEEVARALDYYYEHPDRREVEAEAIYNFVTQDKFRWENIGKQWDELFEEVLSNG